MNPTDVHDKGSLQRFGRDAGQRHPRIAYRGISTTERLQIVLVGFQMLVLAIFTVVAITKALSGEDLLAEPFSWDWFNPFTGLTLSAFVAGVIGPIFAFWGWDTRLTVNEESKDATTMPGRAAIVTRAEQPDALGESTDSSGRTRPRTPAPSRQLAAAGIPTATHAIGDAAVRHVLDALDGIAATPSGPHRVEHIETLPGALIGRFVRQGVVASMQPTHCTHYTRADHTDNWSTCLGAAAPTAHGAAATCTTPGCRWCSAPTGRWPPSTRAACWPTPSCAAPRASPTCHRCSRTRGWTRAPRCRATPPPPRSPRARPVAPGGSRRAPART